ncbi:MAG: ATP-binding cassette domain-containing protein [bacterium]
MAELYPGPWRFYAAEREKRREERLRRFEKEQAEIRRLTETARAMHEHNTEHLNKRAFSIEKRIARMKTTERPKTEATLRVSFRETEFRADEVLNIRGLKKSFGDRTLFSDVNLLMRGGERIALIGDNGTGKSTFLKLILEEEEPDAGFIGVGPAVRMAYLPQQVTFEDEGRTVLETMMAEGRCQAQEARDRLGGFLFRGEDVFTPVSRLSGGEKSRLKLCLVMKKAMNLLILDEPTNHLDIPAREWMEGALSAYGEALLFVSHDRYFIEKFATRIWELRDGVLRDYPFGFSHYLEVRQREAAAPPPPKPPREKKEKPRPAGQRNEKLLRRVEREIAALEEKLAENQRQAEAFASDYEKLLALDAERQELEAALEEKYAAWEELEG